MEDRYCWTDYDITSLAGYAQTVHDGLVTASTAVQDLIAEMKADTTWQAEHKPPFMAWMDLLRQFHERMAGSDVGQAAADDLTGFATSVASFYQNSEAYATLGTVS